MKSTKIDCAPLAGSLKPKRFLIDVTQLHTWRAGDLKMSYLKRGYRGWIGRAAVSAEGK